MLYKDFLVRNGNPLNEEQQSARQECRERRRKARKQAPQPVNDDSDESDSDEDDFVLIKWEMEWWRKEGATIIT